MQKTEEGHSRESSWAPHVTDPFCSLAIFHRWDVALVPGHWGIPHTWGRVERRTEEGFRTISYKDALCQSQTWRGGAVKQGRETACILPLRETGDDVCPPSCILPSENTWLYPTHLRASPFMKEASDQEAILGVHCVSPSQLLEIAVRVVSIDLISKEINL